jgi:hypothetical protein
LYDVGRYRGAFLTNSIGVVAVSRIDDVELAVDVEALARVQAAYDAITAEAFE